MLDRLHRYRIGGVSLAEMGAVLALYSLSAIFYYYAVSTSSGRFTEPYNRYIAEHLTRLLLSLPIWWLMIRGLKEWPIWIKIVLHACILPLYVKGWQWMYYPLADALNIGRMGGTGEVWDVYITSLLYAVQFGFMHAYAYHLKIKEQRAKESVLIQTALQSELTALKAQLNPHFLYNVFNTISASVPKELEHTREMIASLSDLFRYQLRASQEDLVEIQDELDFIKKFLELEKARFGNRLQLHFDVAPELMHKKIPPMILQPLVENAIKHGLAPKIEGGEVSIQIKAQGDKILIEIADTGVGVSDKLGILTKGIGLQNTAKRLEKMYGANIRLEDNQPQGLKISFEL